MVTVHLCSYSFINMTPLSMAVVIAYLRLDTKYQMPRFHTEAISRLTYKFPTALDALKSTQDYSRILDPRSVTTQFFIAVELAHKYDIPQILPWAFYGCCYYLEFEQICQLKGPNEPSLPREDVQTCMEGWQRLVEHQAKDTFAWLCADCPSKKPKTCNATRRKLCWIFEPVPACKALDCWGSPWQDGLCRQCAANAKVSHKAGRNKIWGKLPIFFFGLPSCLQLLK
jgi:hypothetical protein